MAVTSEQMLDGARRAASWLSDHLTDEGCYIGRDEPGADGRFPDTFDIAAHYKSPYFLRVAGEPIAAGRIMNFIVQNFMTSDGDFRNSPSVRSAGSYTVNFCQLYINAFLVRALFSLGWYGLAHKAVEFALRHRDPSTGGFYITVDAPTQIVNSDSTALGGLCCLLSGRIDLAVQSAELLVKLLKEQPDPSRYYSRWENGKGVLTDTGDGPAKYYYVDAGQPGQCYWFCSWPMILFTLLYDITREERFLCSAVDYYNFLASCDADAFASPASGKSGWCSAILYRMTGDKRYLATALSQMDFVLSSQHEKGFMLRPGTSTEEEQSTREIYDNVTADYATWLVDTALELQKSTE